MNRISLTIIHAAGKTTGSAVAGCRRAVVLVTLACFLLSSVGGQGFAAVARERMEYGKLREALDAFALPYTVGRITDARFYGSRKVVINIQDLHCHGEVQKNIGNIIQLLSDRYAIPAVYQEGAIGGVDTSWLPVRKNDPARRELLEGLLHKGELTGAEYYSIVSGKDRLIAGLEHEALYKANVLRLNRILADEDKLRELAAALKSDLVPLQETYYCPRNRRLEQAVEDYRKGKINVRKYYRLLKKYGEKCGLDVYSYTNVIGYLALVEKEKKLDYRLIARQLQEFLGVLKQQLPYQGYRELLARTENFSKLDVLYACLLQLSGDPATAALLRRDYPALDGFLAYMEESQEINPLVLVREERKLVRDIELRFAANDSERDVVFLADFLHPLEEYLQNKITADDYRYFAGNYEKFASLWTRYAGAERLAALAPHRAVLDEFYRCNLERNKWFVANTVGDYASAAPDVPAGDRAKESSLVLRSLEHAEILLTVTGGFHTPGYTDLLKERKVSYLVITPNVTRETGVADGVYRELMEQQGKIFSQTLGPLVLSERPFDDRAQKLVTVYVGVLLKKGYDADRITAEVNELIRDIKSRLGIPPGSPLDSVRFTFVDRDRNGDYRFEISSEGGVSKFYFSSTEGRVTRVVTGGGEQAYYGEKRAGKKNAAGRLAATLGRIIAAVRNETGGKKSVAADAEAKKEDIYLMQAALAEAGKAADERGMFSARVGAVVEKDGRIIGRGYNRKNNILHAEQFAVMDALRTLVGESGLPDEEKKDLQHRINALEGASGRYSLYLGKFDRLFDEAARECREIACRLGNGRSVFEGTTFAVTLEPCGKCTAMLNGLAPRRVIFGAYAVNAKAKGLTLFKASRIAIAGGVLARESLELNRGYALAGSFPAVYSAMQSMARYVIGLYQRLRSRTDGDVAQRPAVTRIKSPLFGDSAAAIVSQLREMLGDDVPDADLREWAGMFCRFLPLDPAPIASFVEEKLPEILHFEAMKLKGERASFTAADAEKEMRNPAKKWSSIAGLESSPLKYKFDMPKEDQEALVAAMKTDGALGALIAKAVAVLPGDVQRTLRWGDDIKISLIDENASTHLFEDHRQNGYIGINRAFLATAAALSKTDPALAQSLFITGIAHELSHEAGVPGEDLSRDGALFWQLMEEQGIPLERFDECQALLSRDLEIEQFAAAVRRAAGILPAASEITQETNIEAPASIAGAADTSIALAEAAAAPRPAIEIRGTPYETGFDIPAAYEQRIERSARVLISYGKLLSAVNVLLAHERMGTIKTIRFHFYSEEDAARIDEGVLHLSFRSPATIDTPAALKVFQRDLGWDFAKALTTVSASYPYLLLHTDDFDTINLVLHKRLAGMGDLVFMVNTAQTFREVFKQKKIRLIFHSDADCQLIGRTKLVKNFKADAAEQMQGGIQIINLEKYTALHYPDAPKKIHFWEKAAEWEAATNDLIGENDVSIVYALGANERAVWQKEQAYRDYAGKAKGKVFVHELGFGSFLQDPLSQGAAHIGVSPRKVGMAPVSPASKTKYREKIRQSAREVRRERKRILRKFPGWESLESMLGQRDLQRTVASAWGFLYAHEESVVKNYFSALETARKNDGNFAAGDKTLFLMCGRSDTKVHARIRQLAEDNDYNLLVYNDELPGLTPVRTSKDGKVTVILDYSVPRKLFGELFLYSDDLPCAVSGQDNLANIIYLNRISAGRPFFWELLVFHTEAYHEMLALAQETLGEADARRLQALWQDNNDEGAKAAAAFTSYDEYRALFRRFASAVNDQKTFLPQMYYLMLHMYTAKGGENARGRASRLIMEIEEDRNPSIPPAVRSAAPLAAAAGCDTRLVDENIRNAVAAHRSLGFAWAKSFYDRYLEMLPDTRSQGAFKEALKLLLFREEDEFCKGAAWILSMPEFAGRIRHPSVSSWEDQSVLNVLLYGEDDAITATIAERYRKATDEQKQYIVAQTVSAVMHAPSPARKARALKVFYGFFGFGARPFEVLKKHDPLLAEALLPMKRNIENAFPQAEMTAGMHRVLRSLPGRTRSLYSRLRTSLKSLIFYDDKGRPGVYAGFPHFRNEWGRDTMIALLGIVSDGQQAVARDTLLKWAGLVDTKRADGGIIANVVPAGDGTGWDNWNTSDAALWFIEAVYQYVARFDDMALLKVRVNDGRRTLEETLREIMERYRLTGEQLPARGIDVARPRVRRDAATGFIFSPAQSTWMDTKYTPREGYAVEIQALWYNANARMMALDPANRIDYKNTAELLKEKFDEFFWNDQSQGLYDMVGAGALQAPDLARRDPAYRPNQLFAVYFGLVDGARAKQILAGVKHRLLVPGALRSLAPGTDLPSGAYHGQYPQDAPQEERDRAYHNGTAWTWLYPFYWVAAVREGTENREAAVRALTDDYTRLMDDLYTYYDGDALPCGSVPELTDGDVAELKDMRGVPCRYAFPKGCGKQAWGITMAMWGINALAPKKHITAFGNGVTAAVEALRANENPLLAMFAQFLAEPSLAAAEMLYDGGVLRRETDGNALSALLERRLAEAVAARKGDFGFDTDKIAAIITTMLPPQLAAEKDWCVLASAGMETRGGERRLFLNVHRVFRNYLAKIVRNNSPPEGFASADEFAATFLRHEVDEYLALHVPSSSVAKAFAGYLARVRSLPAVAANLTSENFHAYIEYLAANGIGSDLAPQAKLLGLAGAIIDEQRALETAFINYASMSRDERTTDNQAFLALETVLQKRDRNAFLDVFAELAHIAEGPDRNNQLDASDVTLLLHELTTKHPRWKNRAKNFLRHAAASSSDPLARGVAEKALRWIDIGVAVFVSPEASPVSKAGGMANVVGELPKMLVDSGLKVYVITPLYKYGEAVTPYGVRRACIRDDVMAKQGMRYESVVPWIYMGRHGSVPMGLARGRIGKVEYLLPVNDDYADALYGQLGGDTTDPGKTVTKEHEALRAQFLSIGALETMKAMHIYPSIVAGNDWMCAPLMALLNSDRSLYKKDRHFEHTRTVGWVHNNGQDYQFKVERRQDAGGGQQADLLMNLGLSPEDFGWFMDPHRENFVNFMRAFIEHGNFSVAVSPGQAEDYLRTDDKGGAEGFLQLFRKLHRGRRLFALVNGIFQKEMQTRYFGKSVFDVATDDEKRMLVTTAIERKIKARHDAADIAILWRKTPPHLDEHTFVVNTIARIAEQKGIKYFIPFIERVVNDPKYSDVVFVLVGAGDPRLVEELKKLSEKYPARVGYSNAFITGPVYDTINLCGDVFVSFSTFEPGGISPMEGKAAGNVCLLSNRQGHKSTVTQGSDGALFDIVDGDDAKTLDNIMREFDWLYAAWRQRASDPRWYAMMTGALFSDHSWDKTVRDCEDLFKCLVLNDRRAYKRLWPKAVLAEPTVRGQAAHLWFDDRGRPAIALDRASLTGSERDKLYGAINDAFSHLDKGERQALFSFQKSNKIQKHTGEWMELPLPVRIERGEGEEASVTPHEIVLNADLLRAPPEVLMLVLLHGFRRSIDRFHPDLQLHDAAVFQKTLMFIEANPAVENAWNAWAGQRADIGTFFGRDWVAPIRHVKELVALDSPWSWWQAVSRPRDEHELPPEPKIYREKYGAREHVYYVYALGDGITKIIRFVPRDTKDWIATDDASMSAFQGDVRIDIVRDCQEVARGIADEREFFGRNKDVLAALQRLNDGNRQQREEALRYIRLLAADLSAPARAARMRDLLFALSKTCPDRQVRLELNRVAFDQYTGRPPSFPVSTFNYSAAAGEPYVLKFKVRGDGEIRVRVLWNVNGSTVKTAELAPVSVRGKTASFEWEVPARFGWVHYAVQVPGENGVKFVQSPYDDASPSSEIKGMEFEYFVHKNLLMRLNGLIKFQELREGRIVSLRPEVFNLRLDEFRQPMVDDNGNMLLGTLDDLRKQLAMIKELGVSEICLQALETGAPGEAGPDPSPFSPLHQVRISRRIGGMKGLLALNNEARAMGMKIALDVIPHLSRSDREAPPRTAPLIYDGLTPVRRAASDGGLSVEWMDGFSRNWADPDNVRDFAAQIAQLAALGFNFRIDVGHAFDTNYPVDPGTVGMARLRGEVTVAEKENVLFEGRPRALMKTLDLRFTEEPNAALAWIIYEAKKAGLEHGHRTRFYAENWHGHETRLIRSGVDLVFDPLVANLWNMVRSGRSSFEVVQTLRYLDSIRRRVGGGYVTVVNNHDAQVPPVDAFDWRVFAAAAALMFMNGGAVFQHLHYSFRNEDRDAPDPAMAAAEIWQVPVNNYGPARIVNGVYWPGFDWLSKVSATEAKLIENACLRDLAGFERRFHELLRGSSRPVGLDANHDRVICSARRQDDDILVGFFNIDTVPARINFCPDDARQDGSGIGEFADDGVYELTQIYDNERAAAVGQSLLVTGAEISRLGIGPRSDLPVGGIQVYRLRKTASGIPARGTRERARLLADSLERMHAQRYGNEDRFNNSFAVRELVAALESSDRDAFYGTLAVLRSVGGMQALLNDIFNDVRRYRPDLAGRLNGFLKEHGFRKKPATVTEDRDGCIGKFNQVAVTSFDALPDGRTVAAVTLDPGEGAGRETVTIRGTRAPPSSLDEDVAGVAAHPAFAAVLAKIRAVQGEAFDDILLEGADFEEGSDLTAADIAGIGIGNNPFTGRPLRILHPAVASSRIARFHERAHIAYSIGRLALGDVLAAITNKEIKTALYDQKITPVMPDGLKFHYALRALQRQYFGQEDVRLTYRIRRLQRSRGQNPPAWAKGLRYSYALLRDCAFTGNDANAFGTFTDLKRLVRHAKEELHLNGVFLMPLCDTAKRDTDVDDSPYDPFSAYALDPRHIDWKATGLKGATADRRWEEFRGSLPGDFALVTGDRRLAEYAHAKTLRILTHGMKGYPHFETAPALIDRADPRDLDGELTRTEAYRRLYGILMMEQYFARAQLQDAVDFAHQQGMFVGIDQPFFRTMDGVDALFRPEIFRRDPDGKIAPAGWNIGGANEQLWGNRETQQGLGSYDWEALKARDYEPLVGPVRYFVETMGFDFVRGDAFHYGFGQEGFYRAVEDVCRRNSALFVPETLGCGDEALVDGTCRTMGMLPVATAGGFHPWKNADNKWEALMAFLHDRSVKPSLWNPAHHDSLVTAEEYGCLFDGNVPLTVRNKVLYAVFALALPNYSVMFGDEYARSTRINEPGKAQKWKNASPFLRPAGDITAALRAANGLRDRYPYLNEYGNLAHWSFDGAVLRFDRTAADGAVLRVAIDVRTGAVQAKEYSLDAIPPGGHERTVASILQAAGVMAELGYVWASVFYRQLRARDNSPMFLSACGDALAALVFDPDATVRGGAAWILSMPEFVGALESAAAGWPDRSVFNTALNAGNAEETAAAVERLYRQADSSPAARWIAAQLCSAVMNAPDDVRKARAETVFRRLFGMATPAGVMRAESSYLYDLLIRRKVLPGEEKGKTETDPGGELARVLIDNVESRINEPGRELKIERELRPNFTKIIAENRGNAAFMDVLGRELGRLLQLPSLANDRLLSEFVRYLQAMTAEPAGGTADIGQVLLNVAGRADPRRTLTGELPARLAAAAAAAGADGAVPELAGKTVLRYRDGLAQADFDEAALLRARGIDAVYVLPYVPGPDFVPLEKTMPVIRAGGGREITLMAGKVADGTGKFIGVLCAGGLVPGDGLAVARWLRETPALHGEIARALGMASEAIDPAVIELKEAEKTIDGQTTAYPFEQYRDVREKVSLICRADLPVAEGAGNEEVRRWSRFADVIDEKIFAGMDAGERCEALLRSAYQPAVLRRKAAPPMEGMEIGEEILVSALVGDDARRDTGIGELKDIRRYYGQKLAKTGGNVLQLLPVTLPAARSPFQAVNLRAGDYALLDLAAVEEVRELLREGTMDDGQLLAPKEEKKHVDRASVNERKFLVLQAACRRLFADGGARLKEYKAYAAREDAWLAAYAGRMAASRMSGIAPAALKDEDIELQRQKEGFGEIARTYAYAQWLFDVQLRGILADVHAGGGKLRFWLEVTKDNYSDALSAVDYWFAFDFDGICINIADVSLANDEVFGRLRTAVSRARPGAAALLRLPEEARDVSSDHLRARFDFIRVKRYGEIAKGGTLTGSDLVEFDRADAPARPHRESGVASADIADFYRDRIRRVREACGVIFVIGDLWGDDWPLMSLDENGVARWDYRMPFDGEVNEERVKSDLAGWARELTGLAALGRYASYTNGYRLGLGLMEGVAASDEEMAVLKQEDSFAVRDDRGEPVVAVSGFGLHCLSAIYQLLAADRARGEAVLRYHASAGNPSFFRLAYRPLQALAARPGEHQKYWKAALREAESLEAKMRASDDQAAQAGYCLAFFGLTRALMEKLLETRDLEENPPLISPADRAIKRALLGAADSFVVTLKDAAGAVLSVQGVPGSEAAGSRALLERADLLISLNRLAEAETELKEYAARRAGAPAVSYAGVKSSLEFIELVNRYAGKSGNDALARALVPVMERIVNDCAFDARGLVTADGASPVELQALYYNAARVCARYGATVDMRHAADVKAALPEHYGYLFREGSEVPAGALYLLALSETVSPGHRDDLVPLAQKQVLLSNAARSLLGPWGLKERAGDAAYYPARIGLYVDALTNVRSEQLGAAGDAVLRRRIEKEVREAVNPLLEVVLKNGAVAGRLPASSAEGLSDPAAVAALYRIFDLYAPPQLPALSDTDKAFRNAFKSFDVRSLKALKGAA